MGQITGRFHFDTPAGTWIWIRFNESAQLDWSDFRVSFQFFIFFSWQRIQSYFYHHFHLQLQTKGATRSWSIERILLLFIWGRCWFGQIEQSNGTWSGRRNDQQFWSNAVAAAARTTSKAFDSRWGSCKIAPLRIEKARCNGISRPNCAHQLWFFTRKRSNCFLKHTA